MAHDATVPVDCPICGAEVSRRLPAQPASFLAARTGVAGPVASNFCSGCQHIFFTPLLDPGQLQALYADYRSAAYTAERAVHEPDYVKVAEQVARPGSDYFRVRESYYDFALPEYRGLKGVVVDFGGHDGHYARYAFPEAEVVVMDEDFERRGGDMARTLARAELIFATHVFEHIPRPLETLARLVDGVRPGTLVFVEVPKEYGAAAGGTIADNFARMERRVAAGERPGHAVLTLHEHVAHFSKASLRRLAERAALEVIELHTSTYGMLSMLSVLARKP